MTTQEIIDGLSLWLSNLFGDDYEIYDTNVEQGLKEPCFLITAHNVTSEKFLNRRERRVIPITVQFFAVKGNNEKLILRNTADKVMDNIHVIKLDNECSVLVNSKEYNITDDILNINLTFGVMMNAEYQRDCFENLNVNTERKNNDE